MSTDRRAFLRLAAGACLASPAALALGCGGGARANGAAARPLPGGSGGRHPLAAFGGGAVRLVEPEPASPVAYLSRAQRRVYVARPHRFRAELRLGAYVSVTTGVWRIPLPGDDPRVPVTPGDPLREYEEMDIAAWDPAVPPAPGDARVMEGSAAEVEVRLACEPLSGDGRLVSGGPWVVRRFGGEGGDGGREDFVQVGLATLHRRAACEGEGSPMPVLGWSASPA